MTQAQLTRSAGLGCVFIALWLLVLVMITAPTPSANRLGIRGSKRGRSLDGASLWSQCEPFVRWLAGRIAPLLPRSVRQRLDRNIVLAGDALGLIPEEYVALCLLSGGVGAGLGAVACTLLQHPYVWAVLAAVVGALLPWLQLSGMAQARALRIQNGLPYAIDLISLGLSAGLDFPGALRQVLAKSSDPSDQLMEEIGYILQELLVGKTRREALLRFGHRCPYDAVTELVATVIQSEEHGNPLADVLQVQATSSRMRRSVRAEESGTKAGLKILVPCLMVFGAVLLMMLGPLLIALEPALGGL